MTFWDAVVWLHVIAMAFFVGGQLFLAAVVVPVERADPNRERLKAMARRFGWGTLIAIAVLLVTGAAMASHFHLWSEPKLHLKLGLVAATAVLVVWHMRKPTWHALEAAIFFLSLAIVWIGLTL